MSPENVKLLLHIFMTNNNNDTDTIVIRRTIHRLIKMFQSLDKHVNRICPKNESGTNANIPPVTTQKEHESDCFSKLLNSLILFL